MHNTDRMNLIFVALDMPIFTKWNWDYSNFSFHCYPGRLIHNIIRYTHDVYRIRDILYDDQHCFTLVYYLQHTWEICNFTNSSCKVSYFIQGYLKDSVVFFKWILFACKWRLLLFFLSYTIKYSTTNLYNNVKRQKYIWKFRSLTFNYKLPHTAI